MGRLDYGVKLVLFGGRRVDEDRAALERADAVPERAVEFQSFARSESMHGRRMHEDHDRARKASNVMRHRTSRCVRVQREPGVEVFAFVARDAAHRVHAQPHV